MVMDFDSEKLKRIQKESIFLLEKYPEHTLIILHTKHKNTVKLDKNKFLINNSTKLQDFIDTLVSKLKIDRNHVLYFKINNTVISDTSKTIKDIYQEYKKDDENNYLVIEICRYTKYIRKAISLLTLNMV
jgi:hypothetical protein